MHSFTMLQSKREGAANIPTPKSSLFISVQKFRISAIDENLLSKSFLRISKHLVLEVNLRIDQLTENVFTIPVKPISIG